MGLKYVLNSMKRRKLRTAIIAMALIVGVALVGALLALIDTQRQFSVQSLGAATGGYDLSISKNDLAASPFFDLPEVKSLVDETDSELANQIASQHARIEVSVEARKVGATEGEAVTALGIDISADTLVSVTTAATNRSGISIGGIRIGSTGGGGGGPQGGGAGGPGGGGGGPPGGGAAPTTGNATAQGATTSGATAGTAQTTRGTYPPSEGQVYLDSTTATALDAKVGDEIELLYAIPTQREAGSTVISGTSTPRIAANFVVAGVGTVSGLNSSVSNPIIMNLSDAQTWLSAAGQANELLLVWESSNSSTDATKTVSAARDVGEEVRNTLQEELGDGYVVALPKYTSLESSSASFASTQTFITLYGLLSMGIVGLMINALMMTTVAEQQHDLAVLRVLGSPRGRLYEAVILEVIILGAIGIVVGVILGRVINDYVMVPIILSNLALPSGVRAAWTLQTVLTPTIITIVVLTLATISPARAAASTKVMVVLNPAAADQPSLEDLAKLRERKPQTGLLIAGFVLLAFSSVILIVLPTVFTAGNTSGQTTVNFGSLLLMVIGISLLFYFLTAPLERVLVRIYQVINPRAAFFAGRYALRGKGRNALISLMVVMSGVLPCLLATQLALQNTNVETTTRFNNGAPLVSQLRSAASTGGFQIFRRVASTASNLTAANVEAITGQPGMGSIVKIADNLPNMTVADPIALRSGTASLVGVADDLNSVLYTNLMRWSEGNATSLSRILTETNSAVISQGLSRALDLHLGDTIVVSGNGTDHVQTLTIIGVAARLPGFSSYFRSTSSSSGSGILINIDTYRELQHDPASGKIDPDADIFTKLLSKVQTGVNETAVLRDLRSYLTSQASGMSVTATSESVTTSRAQLQQQRIFITLLTALSMVTAIFGVLAVMYTAVMGRRVEIGMLKAVGAPRGALRGVFIGEAVITTLSAGVAGIVAGTLLGYAIEGSSYLQRDQPFLLAFDFNTAGIILVLVCFAAVFSATLATQPVIAQKAIKILREK